MNEYSNSPVSYKFVPFPGRVDSFRKEGNLTGRIKLKITTLAPLFISSGYEDSTGDQLFRSFEQLDNKPVIPGSSLKGAIRTISEAVSYSCVTVEQQNRHLLPFVIPQDCKCICCKTYGKMGWKSSVELGDFRLEQGDYEIIHIPRMMSPNPLMSSYLDKAGKFKGIKFYSSMDYKEVENAEIPVQAVIPGAEFRGEVIFKELHNEQLELLCYALGLDNSFKPKIGANKPNGFGKCQITATYAEFRDGKQEFNPKDFALKYGISDEKITANKKLLSEILA